LLTTLMKKEIQHNLYGFKFQVIMLLTLLLVFSSVYVMYNDYSQRTRAYEIQLPDIANTSSLLKPSPLAIFDRGLDMELCSLYETHRDFGILSISNQKDFSSELFRLFNTPDLFYVTWIILSLGALLFSFNLVTAEKEDGTLRQMLASSVARSKLVAGKWTGGLICLVLPFTLAFMVSVTAVSLAPDVQFGVQDYLRLALFLIASLLYLGFFFSLGLLVSAASRSSAAALSISLLLWVTLVFVLPGLGNIAAGKLVAVPSYNRYVVQVRQAEMAERRASSEYESSGKKKDFNLREHDPERDAQVSDYRVRLARLISLSRDLIRLTPAGAYAFLAGDLSNTGVQEMLNLQRSILAYRDFSLGLPRTPSGRVSGEYPAFTYQRLSPGHVLVNGGLLNFALLLLQTTVVFAASYVLFLRYDAR